MELQKVDLFMMTQGKYFKPYHVHTLRERLLSMDDSKWPLINSINLKDPTTMLIISIIAGALAIDRFLIGHTSMAIVKLVTCGGFGIWVIIDWFLIQDATKESNYEKICKILY